MRNVIIVLLALAISPAVLSQEKESYRTYIRMGPQIGFLINGKTGPQVHDVDIYTNSRFMSLNFEGGVGYYLNENNRLELNGVVGIFGLRNKKYKDEFSERNNPYFLYNDFDADMYNSTSNTLSDFKVVIEYLRDYGNEKWTISPSFGGGIRSINHRDYDYVIREFGTNQFTEYALTSHIKSNFFYRLGLRFFHERWPDTEWNLNVSGGEVKYAYLINQTSPNPSAIPVDVNYKIHMIVISLGVKFKSSTQIHTTD